MTTSIAPEVPAGILALPLNLVRGVRQGGASVPAPRIPLANRCPA